MTAQSGLGIGARLAGARLRARLSVVQAAERLHVDPSVIEALEAERFEELGASVYARGHISHYAELVAEQPADLLALYATSVHAGQTPDLRKVPQAKSPNESSRVLLLPAIAVVAAVAVIGTVWWVAGTLRAVPRVHRAGVTLVSHPAQGSAATGAGSAPARGTTETSMSSSRPVVASTPVQGNLSLAAALPAQATPSQGATTDHGAGAAATSPVRPASLSMRFAQDSWTEVYDAQGRRLFYDIGFADSTRTVRGTPPLRVVLGNPAGVSLRLDGRPVAIPDSSERDELVRFRIARSGRAMPSHLAAAAEHRVGTSGGRTP